MDEEPSFDNETCVDAVHPRIAAITNDRSRRSKPGRRQDRDRLPRDPGNRNKDGLSIIETGSAGSSSSVSTNTTEDLTSKCSSCEDVASGHSVEFELRRNNVEIIRKRNSNGTVTVKFVFPPKSHLKPYLPEVLANEETNHDLKEDYLHPRISSCCKQ